MAHYAWVDKDNKVINVTVVKDEDQMVDGVEDEVTGDQFLKETHKDIKIIVLIRDLIEVLPSFILWSDKNPNNFHDRTNLKTIEERCENLMQGSILSHAILAIENLLLPENKDLYLLIRYNDLINNPNDVIKKIYKWRKHK